MNRLHDAIPFEKNFRWRGREVSCVEAFSDAVFAFSLTLLVVSLEAPRSYEQLVGALWTTSASLPAGGKQIPPGTD